MATAEIKAYAKLNLSLDVLGRREDGYHDLRMVMQSVTLTDDLRLEIGTGAGLKVDTDLCFLPNDEKNLAASAALKFQAAAGVELGGVSIHIRKTIPVCAGLAGGSSDAAATLLALNGMTGMGWSRERLAALGEQVGSDVPYCVLGGTALAEGRGERLTPLPPLPRCHVVLCKPKFAVSTPELFAQVDRARLRRRPDISGQLEALEGGDLPGVARRMYNVFEDVLPVRQQRVVEEIKTVCIARGALGASMSGTGPTVFGLFAEEGAARSAWEELRGNFRDTFLVQTV